MSHFDWREPAVNHREELRLEDRSYRGERESYDRYVESQRFND